MLRNLFQPLPIPKTINGQAVKHYRSLAKAYDNLAEVFKDGISKETTADRLKAEIDAGQAIWQDVHLLSFINPYFIADLPVADHLTRILQDRNIGIVLQVMDAFRRFSILKLGQTYAALTIAEVAQRTSDDPNDLDGTARYLMLMISNHQLNAALTKAEDVGRWVLRFGASSTTGPLARTEEQLNEEINKQLTRTAILSNHVRELDRKMGLSKEYIEWAKKVPKDKELSPNGDLDRGPFQGPDEFGPEDEDMMEDL